MATAGIYSTSVHRGCVVCELFPGHHGGHYTVRDVSTLLFITRRRRLVSCDWTPLSGCLTRDGKRVLVCTHMVDDPDARTTDGIWLREEAERLLQSSPVSSHEEFDPGLSHAHS